MKVARDQAQLVIMDFFRAAGLGVPEDKLIELARIAVVALDALGESIESGQPIDL
jgi:hypothetical protein